MFKYPIGDGTRQDFETRFYIATGFGIKRPGDTYIHEGLDLNLKTGGDSDLGLPINAVSDWKSKYYHLKAHLESGFGEHYVYEVDTPWGKRWIHCAHNQNSIDFSKKLSGKIGDKLSEIDKTGRPRGVLPAHLHLSVFKVDPGNLPNGIDSIAKTKEELNNSWEDPLDFFNKWNDYKDNDMDIRQLIIDLRLGLLSKAPSDDEIKYDTEHWENPKSFIERITGDSKFYQKYIQPQLDGLKITLESAYSSEKAQTTIDWQIKLDSANSGYDTKMKEQKVYYEKLLLKKYENLSLIKKLRLLFR